MTVYTHTRTGRTQDVKKGSGLDKRLAASPEWEADTPKKKQKDDSVSDAR